MRSRARFTYDEVQQQLDAGTAEEPLQLLREIGTAAGGGRGGAGRRVPPDPRAAGGRDRRSVPAGVPGAASVRGLERPALAADRAGGGEAHARPRHRRAADAAAAERGRRRRAPPLGHAPSAWRGRRAVATPTSSARSTPTQPAARRAAREGGAAVPRRRLPRLHRRDERPTGDDRHPRGRRRAVRARDRAAAAAWSTDSATKSSSRSARAWNRRRGRPTRSHELPELMADGRRREGAADRMALDLVEAAVLSGCIGAELDGVVTATSKGRASVQVRDPAVVAPVDARRAPPGDEVELRVRSTDVAHRTVGLRRQPSLNRCSIACIACARRSATSLARSFSRSNPPIRVPMTPTPGAEQHPARPPVPVVAEDPDHVADEVREHEAGQLHARPACGSGHAGRRRSPRRATARGLTSGAGGSTGSSAQRQAQLVVGLRPVDLVDPFLELGQREPARGRLLPQHVGHGLTLRVRDPDDLPSPMRHVRAYEPRSPVEPGPPREPAGERAQRAPVDAAPLQHLGGRRTRGRRTAPARGARRRSRPTSR